MRSKLIELWECAMRNPKLCSESRQHIEYVLGAEYETLIGKE